MIYRNKSYLSPEHVHRMLKQEKDNSTKDFFLEKGNRVTFFMASSESHGGNVRSL